MWALANLLQCSLARVDIGACIDNAQLELTLQESMDRLAFAMHV